MAPGAASGASSCGRRPLHLPNLIAELERLQPARRYGRVTGVPGMLLEVGGLPREMAVGGRVEVLAAGRRVPCEVIGFRGGRALLMPFSTLDGIGLGCKVEPMPGADAMVQRTITSLAPRARTRSQTWTSEPPVATMGSHTRTRRPSRSRGRRLRYTSERSVDSSRRSPTWATSVSGTTS